MKNDPTTRAWQHDIGCPISIVLFSTSDGTEISLRADILLPWADIPQSALGSAKSQHPPKCGTQ